MCARIAVTTAVVAVAPGHVTAFAPDDPGHLVLLERSTRAPLPECWHDLGVGAAAADPAVRRHHCRARRGTARTGSFPAVKAGCCSPTWSSIAITPPAEIGSPTALWPEPVPASAAAGLNPVAVQAAQDPRGGRGRGPIERALAAAERQQRRCGEAAEAVHRAESKVALGEWKRAWAPSQRALFVAERTLLARRGCAVDRRTTPAAR